jgi:hypothetical protein
MEQITNEQAVATACVRVCGDIWHALTLTENDAKQVYSALCLFDPHGAGVTSGGLAKAIYAVTGVTPALTADVKALLLVVVAGLGVHWGFNLPNDTDALAEKFANVPGAIAECLAEGPYAPEGEMEEGEDTPDEGPLKAADIFPWHRELAHVSQHQKLALTRGSEILTKKQKEEIMMDVPFFEEIKRPAEFNAANIPKGDGTLKALEQETSALLRLEVTLCSEHNDDAAHLNLVVLLANHRQSIINKRKEPIVKASLLDKDKDVLFSKEDTKLLKEERELQAALKQATPSSTSPSPWQGKGKAKYQGKGYAYQGKGNASSKGQGGHQRSSSTSGGRGYSGGRGKGKGASSRGKGGATTHTPTDNA